MPTSILIVGDAEWLPPGAQPGRAAPRMHVSRAESLASARVQLARAEEAPDLLVLVQARPGEFDGGGLERLRADWPLVRLARVTGSWCEGEARSGRPPSACASLAWHLWPWRMERELAQADQRAAPAWAQAVTTSPDERTLADAEHRLAGGGGRLAVVAERASQAAALTDFGRQAGYDPVVVQPCSKAGVADGPATSSRAASSGAFVAALWDTVPESLGDANRVAQIRSAALGAPLVAVVGFPRPDDVLRAQSAGVAAVVAKPYSIHDLAWRLAECVR